MIKIKALIMPHIKKKKKKKKLSNKLRGTSATILAAAVQINLKIEYAT